MKTLNTSTISKNLISTVIMLGVIAVSAMPMVYAQAMPYSPSGDTTEYERDGDIETSSSSDREETDATPYREESSDTTPASTTTVATTASPSDNAPVLRPSTIPASITKYGIQLNGTVSVIGGYVDVYSPTTFWFEYGTTASDLQYATAPQTSISRDVYADRVIPEIAGEPLYYRFVAYNQRGTVYGKTLSINTIPVVATTSTTTTGSSVITDGSSPAFNAGTTNSTTSTSTPTSSATRSSTTRTTGTRVTGTDTDSSTTISNSRFTDEELQALFGDNNNRLSASAFGAGFFPASLTGWIILLLIILAFVVLARYIFATLNKQEAMA